MKKGSQWFVVPLILLTLGVLLSGYVLWKIVTRSEQPENSQNSTNSQGTNTQPPQCGNGVCEDVACLSTNCPVPENAENCPEDCAISNMTGGTDTGARLNQQNSNVSVDTSKALGYSVSSQSLEEKKVCPLEESNLTPEAAVTIAQNAGLTQGVKDIEVRLYQYGTPLNQCVWSIKNFLSLTNGKHVLVIDSTQEVFQQNKWNESSS